MKWLSDIKAREDRAIGQESVMVNSAVLDADGVEVRIVLLRYRTIVPKLGTLVTLRGRVECDDDTTALGFTASGFIASAHWEHPGSEEDSDAAGRDQGR